ncbi:MULTISPECIES: SDR family NAD(P)-dependent oxidoreductase [unclassified Cupriavidus]|uniref:SDR family NAD(P)-dependent oxidoreductase n=1 Tax=unclassified Cupriavidus TaxID=2640874 RepID=UPI0003F72251|nr:MULTISPECIES: SDR family oxidoreductase [unclassified Cupriavidus]MBP0636690.1 SDR family oxidoreductase [Cupriavidus sp. AcVe19-6a]
MTLNLTDLNGKIAAVTGAGQGVGREVALHFARSGARAVIVNDFYAERAQAVVQEIEALGVKGVAAVCDVTDQEQVKAAFAQAAHEAGGSIDILVNNAGNSGVNPNPEARKHFWEVGEAAWDSFIRVNFYGVINCTAAVVPGMIEKNAGRLITIISDAGRVGEPNLEIYSGAKAGAAGFMRGAARALGRYNITANCVAISATATPAIAARLEADPDRTKKMLSNYVIRRVGQPEDVANMVLFLASGSSSWITGQTYPVNGGFSFNL